jgi:hypothetical protein
MINVIESELYSTIGMRLNDRDESFNIKGKQVLMEAKPVAGRL